jgi:hypothetical protein
MAQWLALSFKYMRTFLVVATFLLISGCTEEEVTSRPYSRLRTTSVTDVTASTAVFKAEITYNGGVTDHGFVWTNFGFAALTDPDATFVSLGATTAIGNFTANASNLQSGKNYWVRSYARSGKYTVYGDEFFFKTK